MSPPVECAREEGGPSCLALHTPTNPSATRKWQILARGNQTIWVLES